MSWLSAAQSNFFDRPAVIRAMGRARRRVLVRAGIFVRQRAKTSMRRRRRSSPPGQPPSVHRGELRRFLYARWDPRTETVVVGPERLPLPGFAPHALEYGGRSARVNRRWVSGPRYGNRPQVVSGLQRIRIAARPYMRPALRAEAPNFPQLWRDSVRP